VLGTLLCIALLLVVSVFPIPGNIEVLTVLSGSMEPAIHTGSVVVIKPVSSYTVGDVITFGARTKTDVPTTHRIVKTRVEEGDMVFTTKGDANNSADNQEVIEKDVIGKVYVSIPFLGYLIDFVKRPFGLMLVIVIPAVVIVYDQMRRIAREVVGIRHKKALAKKDENSTI